MKSPVRFLLALLCLPGAAPAAPRTFAYVLQAEALAPSRPAAARLLAGCDRDWIVLDPSYDASPEGKWTPADIRSIRRGKPGRSVLAYLSIGEAEDYRPYWNPAWDADRDGAPDASAPAWLGAENPDWKGNYAVRYWQADWQRIVLSQLEDILQAGFDGAYLDLVDAFESFEHDPAQGEWIDHRPNPETGVPYRQEMAAWVRRLADLARQTHPGFLVVPQNGVQLLEDDAFRNTISAIGVEDLFTEGDRAQPSAHVAFALGFLQRLPPESTPVLLIEYGTRPAAARRALRGAAENGFLLLRTDRGLKTLGTSLPPALIPSPASAAEAPAPTPR